MSADAEREAMRSAVRIDEEPLRAYVRDVQCRVVPAYCPDVRVQVFRRPAFNATVMPNGFTEVWSGLLIRLDNEAQLAFVLGHEAAHFRGNHSLRQWNSMKRSQGALLALGLAASAAATFDSNYVNYADYVDVLQTAAYFGAIASLFAYSREFEEEADLVGQSLMAQAGYDPHEASRVWITVRDLTAASDNERIRRSESRGSIFRTHPLTAQRLARLDQLADQLEIRPVSTGAPARGELGAQRYRAAIRPYLAGWLRDEIRGRDFGATLKLLERLGAGGDLGLVRYFEGEVYRLRRGPGDADKALAAYASAVTEADAPPEAWRELGAARLRAGDPVAARSAFEAYLQRAPSAADQALIRRQIERLAATAPATAAPAPPAGTPP